MINPLDKKEINFIGHRKIFLAISLLLVIASVLLVAFKGIPLSTEFVGGSTITYVNMPDGTTEGDVREALQDAGYEGTPQVQVMNTNGVEGFLARIDVTDAQVTESLANTTASAFGIGQSDIQVSTIGPNWGADVVKSSVIAFGVGLLLILIYVAIRFRDAKIGAVAIVALLHDLIIVLGVYALAGRELTPNTIAAVLTIMGYSLYDTIVTFHSIKDNANSGKFKQNFWTIANHSINEVIVRTMNTTISSIVPVIFMLIFGGPTLSDFAFAMLIGLLAGSYSSVGLAAPIYAIWKSHELAVAEINVKYGSRVNTDVESIMGYEKGPEDVKGYIAMRKAESQEKFGKLVGEAA